MDYQRGDTPAPGLKITAVIKGDKNDTFSHYIFRKQDEDGNWKEFKTKEFLHGHIIKKGARRNTLIPVEFVCKVGAGPGAARIHVKVEGELRSQIGRASCRERV